MAVLQPGQRFGAYRLGSLISRGGMGEVWRAQKSGPDGWTKTVALKLILPTLDEARFAELFLGEARIAAALDHSNVVPVTGYGREQGLLFIEMEYVHGQDLRHILQRARGGLPLQLALLVTAEALKGLAYAHERRGDDGRALGIVHRDVKPHNVLVSYEGAVKLSDFGIAKATAETGASRSEIKGTAGYMAPEILDGKPASPRSDLFALGLVAWECLTGKRLFDGETEAERLRRAYECNVPALAELEISVPAQVEDVLRRLLARDPAARFASAGEALSAVLAAPGARAATSVELKSLLARLFPEESSRPSGAGLAGLPEHVAEAPLPPGGTMTGTPLPAPTGTMAGEAQPTSLVTRLNRRFGTGKMVAAVALLAAATVAAAVLIKPTKRAATAAAPAAEPAAVHDAAVAVAAVPVPVPAADPAAADPAAAAAPAPAPVPTSGRKSAATARLVITVDPPDARVTVDGRALAGPPFVLDGLAPGSFVTVHVERDGYLAQDVPVTLQAAVVQLPVRLSAKPQEKKPRPPTGVEGKDGVLLPD